MTKSGNPCGNISAIIYLWFPYLSMWNAIMKKLLFSIFVLLLSIGSLQAQTKLDTLLPVRGFCIAAPQSSEIENFIKFIKQFLLLKLINLVT